MITKGVVVRVGGGGGGDNLALRRREKSVPMSCVALYHLTLVLNTTYLILYFFAITQRQDTIVIFLSQLAALTLGGVTFSGVILGVA